MIAYTFLGLLIVCTLLLSVCALLLYKILHECYTVQIVKRHKGEWVAVEWVPQHSEKINKALETPNMAVWKDGKYQEGAQ